MGASGVGNGGDTRVGRGEREERIKKIIIIIKCKIIKTNH